jgi:Uma2 family endonuclease
MSTATLISVEQFAAMPRDEAVHYELVEGELVEVSSATLNHAMIRDGLCVALWVFLHGKSVGVVAAETDCRTAGETVRRPDLSVLTKERLALVDRNKVPLPFAPDIAIEILSRTEKAVDVLRKINEYLAAGSSEVWLIDPDNVQVLIHTAAGGRRLAVGDNIESPLLPGFSLGVAEALAGPNLSGQ